MDDPYKIPLTELDSNEYLKNIKLFTLDQIMCAAFLGNWIAGSLLVSANYFQMRNKSLGIAALLLGILGFCVLGYLFYLFNQTTTPKWIINVVMGGIFSIIAKSIHGPAIKKHFECFRPGRTNWLVALAIIISWSPIILALAIVMVT